MLTARNEARISVPMSRKPRSNMVWTEPQHAWLCTEADRLGIHMSELARRIIDHYRCATWHPTVDPPEGQDGASIKEQSS